MPTIEITDDQREYLDALAEELAERHVGEYGTVLARDALQFLIDRREDGAESGEAAAEPGDDAGEGSEEDDAGEEAADDDDAAEDGASRLQAMMSLMETHDDKWEETDAEEGRYAVTLPDGGTEHVRTQDDVRALLFRHYE